MISRRAIYGLIILLLMLGGIRPVSALQGDSETFENGHTVSGEFLQFYHSVDDPQRIFGLPISVVFDDPLQPGIQIQYFQRARMDYDPSQPAGKRITLGKLGEFAHNEANPGQPVLLPPSNAMCRQFSNAKSVCYGFMQLYDRYGEKYFGLPITNAEYTVDGRQVQYFERVRMEWRNEMPVGQRVVISPLGLDDFEQRIGNSNLLKPPNGSISRKVVPALYAFTRRPLVAVGDMQSIYALIYDQYGQPIRGVNINITITYPQGGPGSQTISAPQTNELGYTEVSFTISKVLPNQVIQVSVEANMAGDINAAANTWFRVWW